MTQAEKMAEEWLKASWNCATSPEQDVVTLIRYVSERTREEICKKNAKGIDENTGKIWESDIVRVKDIRNARWEDEEVKLPGFKDIIGLYKDGEDEDATQSAKTL